METVQDLLSRELMQEESSENNETLQLMGFMRDEGVPLTNHQAAAVFLLHENGVGDLANFILQTRRKVVPTKKYMDLLNKLTLADRIKGNAKLAGILKANANPANGLGAGKEPKQ